MYYKDEGSEVKPLWDECTSTSEMRCYKHIIDPRHPYSHPKFAILNYIPHFPIPTLSCYSGNTSYNYWN